MHKQQYLWVSNPFKTGRYCVVDSSGNRQLGSIHVSNPFKTGRYCVEEGPRLASHHHGGVSNPFKTGRYCVADHQPRPDPRPPSFKPLQNGAVLRRPAPGVLRADRLVSNPFKTGRYCVVIWTLIEYERPDQFQTPSKRGGTA